MPVAGGAPDALALAAVPLIEHHAQRHVKRTATEPGEVVTELLDPRFVAHRRVEVGRAGRRLARIRAALAMDLVEVLRLRVVRLELVVSDRPGRRRPAVVAELAEVLPPEPEQRGAIELGVAAHPVVGVRMQVPPLRVAPMLA